MFLICAELPDVTEFKLFIIITENKKTKMLKSCITVTTNTSSLFILSN